ncbi:16S rRNA (uracil(1498)-N(3))-methyltransferase [Thermodesulfovibrio sp. 1176]|uniref:16S rRNA (uracil(1498)-N(3))-methyltransferase n=1 Tax=Thermodesulfovibrio sp. 1176 TaxID=3043424 RepID=UPI00248308FF|nr:16S rRNA (uracil(1498)-N(3))-methyltransferase [Thermodesulfovibrio sp. 1176]MDI1471567.1 16S rRNA (uracil(1498)-N(3))-methyltransferase [Thermodesulfovibrio sp. 1176]
MTEIRLTISYTEIFPNKIVEISKEDRNYIFNVLRLKIGNSIIVIDGKGKSFKAKIIDKNKLEIIEEDKKDIEDPFSLILCQALLKGEKMDMIIQKTTELGVKKIIPFVSERCILKNTNKIERWRKIAKEASEQSGRNFVPEISDLTNFENLINKIDNGLLFWEKEENSLISLIKELDISKPIFLLIGPEGGFSEKEILNAREKGIKTASLGKRILRAETASIVSLSILNFLLQNYDIIKK